MIICAAIKHVPTGAVFGGIRHGNIHESMHNAGVWPHKKDIIEGFLDSENNFYDRTEPFNVASVIRTIYNQPTFNFNNCEDCVFEEECDTHPMHCNSFMTSQEYWDEWNKHRKGR